MPLGDSSATVDSGTETAPELAAGSALVEPLALRSEHHLFSSPPAVHQLAARSD
jgi:hypothetical protein